MPKEHVLLRNCFGRIPIESITSLLGSEAKKRFSIAVEDKELHFNKKVFYLNLIKKKGIACCICKKEATHFKIYSHDNTNHLKLFLDDRTYFNVFCKKSTTSLDNSDIICIKCERIHKANKSRKKKEENQYKDYGRFSLEEIIPQISEEDKKIEVVTEGKLHTVGVCSLRMQNFKIHGNICIGCGAIGTHFKLRKLHTSKFTEGKYHLNLFTEDDILMTCDHIVPRSKGGSDIIENTQTMCTICNKRKGNTLPEDFSSYVIYKSNQQLL